MRRAPVLLLCALMLGLGSAPAWPAACARPLVLAVDSATMTGAQRLADRLTQDGIAATFFVSSARTASGGTSLDNEWAPWWLRRSAEGHDFASATWSRLIWSADAAGGEAIVARATAGVDEGRKVRLDQAELCTELSRPLERLQKIGVARSLRVFVTNGERVSARLVKMAAECGFRHVPTLPLEPRDTSRPLPVWASQLAASLKGGEVLRLSLVSGRRGRSTQALEALDAALPALAARGHCFAPLREHALLRATKKRKPTKR